MTREEAIKQLKGMVVGAEWLSEYMVKALDMAIKALEQEPSGDLISRQAVQDYIAKYLSQYLYDDVREAVEVIDEYIGELPSVNPQEPFMNKPCVSNQVCHEDKVKVLDKIRAEIEAQVLESLSDGGDDWFTAEKVNECLDIIDKYRGEQE